MANLPTPIRKQLEQIEELYKPAAALAPAEGEGEPAPAPEPPADEPEAVENTQTETPSTDAAVPAEPPAPAPAPVQDDEAKWEHRFKTLQGMHNQNMADSKRRLQEANALVADLKKQIASIKAEKAAPTVDPKDVETFGEDLLGMVQRVVDAKLGHTQAQMDNRLVDLESQVQGTVQTVTGNAEALFLDRLAAMVPDYEAVNVEQGLLDWLAIVDPIYGEPRQAALDRAVAALNPVAVAAIFNAYKAAKGAAAAPAPGKPSPQSQLAKQASPRGSSSTPPAAPAASKRIYRQSEVAQFYDDVTKGRYRGRQEEMKREEAAINAALAEGRIA